MKFLATSKANNKKQPKASIKPNDCLVGSVAIITIPKTEHDISINHLKIVSIIEPFC